MGKKPKNKSQSLMVKNAKRKKVSKDPSVRYPTIEDMKKRFDIHVSDNEVHD